MVTQTSEDCGGPKYRMYLMTLHRFCMWTFTDETL